MIQLAADRGARIDAFSFFDVFQRVLKRHADRVAERLREAVCQTGREIRLVGYHVRPARSDHDGKRDESALAEDNVGLYFLYHAPRFQDAAHDAERIQEVLHGKIPSELSAADPVVRHGAQFLDQLFFHTALAPDVRHLVAAFLELFDQRDIRDHVPGRSAARHNDLHAFTFRFQIFTFLIHYHAGGFFRQSSPVKWARRPALSISVRI